MIKANFLFSLSPFSRSAATEAKPEAIAPPLIKPRGTIMPGAKRPLWANMLGCCPGEPGRSQHLVKFPVTALKDSEQCLIGVARWKAPGDSYVQKLPKDHYISQAIYGEKFHKECIKQGGQIGRGELKSFDEVWNSARNWRVGHLNATEQKSADSFKTSRNNVPTGTPYLTPIRTEWCYADVWQQLVQPGTHKPPSMTVKSDYGDVDVYARAGTVTLGGKEIPLTTLKAFCEAGETEPTVRPNELCGWISGEMVHTDSAHLPVLMNRANELFERTLSKGRTPQQRLNDLAEMNWLLAHAMPDHRGSSAKTEMVVRSTAYAAGIELSAFKDGKVHDLEAFMMSKEDFIKNYAGMFDKPPDMSKCPKK